MNFFVPVSIVLAAGMLTKELDIYGAAIILAVLYIIAIILEAD